MSQPINRQRQPPPARGRPNNPSNNQSNNQQNHSTLSQSGVRAPPRPSYPPRPPTQSNQSNKQSVNQPVSRSIDHSAYQSNNHSNTRSNNRSSSSDRYDTSIEMPSSDNQSFRFRRQNLSNNRQADQTNRQSINQSKREIKLTNNQSIKFSRFVTLFFIITFVMIAVFGLYTIHTRSLKQSNHPSFDQPVVTIPAVVPSNKPHVGSPITEEEPLPSIHDQSINPEYNPPQQSNQNSPAKQDQMADQYKPVQQDQSINQKPSTNEDDQQVKQTNKISDSHDASNPVSNPNAAKQPIEQVNNQPINSDQPIQSVPPTRSTEKQTSEQMKIPVDQPSRVAQLPYGNTSPVPFMSQSPFPHTADGHPLFSPPSSVQYSSFYCAGGRGRADGQKDRACRFQNLCFDQSINQWLFYQDPATKGKMPIILDHGEVVSEFPAHFLNLRALGGPADARWWAPKQVYSAIPTAAHVPRRHEQDGDVYMLYAPRDLTNLGFVLGDDFYPLFNLAATFGMVTNDAQLLMTTGCEGVKDDKAARCRDLLTTLAPGMSSRPILAVGQSDFAKQIGMDGSSSVMCFENVLAGIGPWGFQQSLGKAPTWWQFRHYYLSNMGLVPNHTPKKHRITVSIKAGDRAIYNTEAMVAHLKKVLPNHEVDAVELYKLGGWQQELAYLRDTTVLITPCGQISMPAMFLPHGAALIVVDYWNTNKNNMGGMEEKLWSSLGYVRPYHYPFTESEVVLDKEGKDRKIYQHMRDWGRVNIDVKRMEMLVKDAIRHVDSFMVMGQE